MRRTSSPSMGATPLSQYPGPGPRSSRTGWPPGSPGRGCTRLRPSRTGGSGESLQQRGGDACSSPLLAGDGPVICPGFALCADPAADRWHETRWRTHSRRFARADPTAQSGDVTGRRTKSSARRTSAKTPLGSSWKCRKARDFSSKTPGVSREAQAEHAAPREEARCGREHPDRRVSSAPSRSLLRELGFDVDRRENGVGDEAVLVRQLVQLRHLLLRGARGPPNSSLGRSVTRVMASLPFAFFSMSPIASSV